MIDFRFIEKLEGNVTRGYVPDPDQSISGVTIGCGFDIGARTREELQRDLPANLAEKLIPYAELKKHDAVQALAEKPLQLSNEEVSTINEYAKQQAISRLKLLWESYDTCMAFDDLPTECQSVIASVAFQYGNLAKRTPNFWRQVTQGDWSSVISNLRNFGDKYATRRNKEADLLASIF